ncbi:MAG: hypothetical protein IT536_13870 [Hyphomicrobiales bacterium]|nr:hypothetical protein [Hyphomicrobiales bacterium]
MILADITLPEVRAHAQSARFFTRGSDTLVEIAFVGSKDTSIQKVTPEHMARFKAEWDAFCDGRPPEQRPGTALSELPSIDDARANDYIARNVHNLDELAALNDGQCQSLGHGTLRDRREARSLLAMRRLEQRERLQREVNDKQATVGKAATPDANAEIAALRSELAELKAMLRKALSLAPRGRPKKSQTGGERPRAE